MNGTLELYLLENQSDKNGLLLGLQELQNMDLSDLMTIYVDKDSNRIVYKIVHSEKGTLDGQYLKLVGIQKLKDKLFGKVEGTPELTTLEKYILRTINAYKPVSKIYENLKKVNINESFAEFEDFMVETNIPGLCYRKLLSSEKNLVLGVGLGSLYLTQGSKDYNAEHQWQEGNYSKRS